MLNEGWRRHERGTDVVVGFVETHGRPAHRRAGRATSRSSRAARSTTAARPSRRWTSTPSSPATPRSPSSTSSPTPTCPGPATRSAGRTSRSCSTPGIDVISTVNIQHLESLNDVVEGITGIQQQETIPDAVVRAAEQIELVDSTPEALRRRMAHGNIYGPDKVDAALGNYFRPGNLAALRELALLWVADRVDESLQEYRERHGIAAPWETRERVAVAVTGAPGNDNLIRRAARIASRAKGDLIGVHVRADDGLATPRRRRAARAPPAPRGARRHLPRGRRLRRRQGARAGRPRRGRHPARARRQPPVALGRAHPGLGHRRHHPRGRASPRRPRHLDQRATATAERAAAAADPDAADPAAAPPADRRLRCSPSSGSRSSPSLLTQFRDELGFTSAAFCYLMLVVAVATVGGVVAGRARRASPGSRCSTGSSPSPSTRSPSATSATSSPSPPSCVVAGVVSTLVDVAARRAAEANRARSEAEALAGMAGSLLRKGDPIPELLANLVALFRLDHAAVVRTDPEPEVVAEAGAGARRRGTTTLEPPAHRGRRAPRRRARPARAPTARCSAPSPPSSPSRSRAGGCRRRRPTAEALVQGNELRTALLAAVSHDLRTPLASIKASASSLLSDDVVVHRRRRRAPCSRRSTWRPTGSTTWSGTCST